MVRVIEWSLKMSIFLDTASPNGEELKANQLLKNVLDQGRTQLTTKRADKRLLQLCTAD